MTDSTFRNGPRQASLSAVTSYLAGTRWDLIDRDGRTQAWRQRFGPGERDLVVVLPATEELADYPVRLHEALRTLSFAERRLPDEILSDIDYGGADTIAIRMTPDAPDGMAPLGVAHAVIGAARSWIVGAASALETFDLVLPARRPPRAESFADQARISTAAGSFVLSLSIPLADQAPASLQQQLAGQTAIEHVPPQAYGRRVTTRMIQTATHALRTAAAVAINERTLSEAFSPNLKATPNTAELEALANLGGPAHEPYQVRFAPSPLAPGASPERLVVSSAQQVVLQDAAEHLRSLQPESNITVVGLVVRLYRAAAYGRGEIVIQGVDDRLFTQRRYRLELDEADYAEAVRAHQGGLQVRAEGDLETRGTHLWLRRVASFDVVPPLPEE
jgi:hypothetical protein